MMEKKFIITVPASVAVISLTGCNALHSEGYSTVKKTADNRLEEGFEAQRDALIPKLNSNSQVVDDFYIDKTAINIASGVHKNLPIIFDKEISYLDDNKIELKDLLLDLYNLTNMKIDFIYDKDGLNDEESSSPTKNEIVIDTKAPKKEGSENGEEAAYDVNEHTKLKINFTGKLKDFLNYIAAKTNYKWKYDPISEKIFFYKYNTKTFQLYSVSEKFNMQTQINTASSSKDDKGGTSGGNSQKIQFNSSGDNFKSTIEAVKAMLSPKGRITANKALSSITVTDTDYVLSKVEKYIKKINEDASKQVVLQLQIFNVKINNKSNLGINWQIVNKDLSKFASPLSNVQANINFGKTMVPGTSEFQTAFTAGTGSSYMLGLLNEVGTVSSVSNFSVTTLNNQPVPIQIAQNVTYISQVTVTQGVNGAQPTLSPQSDSVKESVSMIATPKIIGQNIILQYAIGLSVIDRIEQGLNGVEKPVTSTKQIVQKVIVKNGQSTVVGAFEKQDNKTNNSGPIDADNWMLGGQEKYDKNKEVMVIVVTPYIIDTNNKDK